MIKTKDIRNHIPRLKMGKHHIFAEKLNDYLDQQEKVNELLELYRKSFTKNISNINYEEWVILESQIKELESELK